MRFYAGTQPLVRKDEVLERGTTSNEEDKVSKGKTTSCEGGRGFVDDVNLRDKYPQCKYFFLKDYISELHKSHSVADGNNT
jgi:hypothetical protein